MFLEAFFAGLIIVAQEGMDMEMFDVPRAYFNADMLKDNFILLNIEEEFLDIMCQVNLEHNKM